MRYAEHLAHMRETEAFIRLEFKAFWDARDHRDPTFFMFFTSGLLHSVRIAAASFPLADQLVLIGSGLTPPELNYCRSQFGDRFVHLSLDIDDKSMWDILFEIVEDDFGWVDADCFVDDESLLVDMMRLDRDCMIRSAYMFPRSVRGVELARTHLLFVGGSARREVWGRREVRPTTYGFVPSGVNRRSHAFSPVVDKSQHAPALLPWATLDERGWPVDDAPGVLDIYSCGTVVERYRSDITGNPTGQPLYPMLDTLVLFQLVGLLLGWKIESVADGASGPSEFRCVHVGGMSYGRRYGKASPLSLGVELGLVADEIWPDILPEYRALRESVGTYCLDNGLAAEVAMELDRLAPLVRPGSQVASVLQSTVSR